MERGFQTIVKFSQAPGQMRGWQEKTILSHDLGINPGSRVSPWSIGVGAGLRPESQHRGTRVWAVQKLVNGVPQGPLCALKDVWVHETRDPEHKVLKEIREAQPAYSRHLLTPLDYGYVPHDLAKPSIPDNTHKNLRHRKLELTGRVLRIHTLPISRPPTGTTDATPRKTKSVSRDSVGGFEAIPNWSRGGHVYLSRDAREHYRIVFEEIGEPVHDLRKFTDIFTAIQGGWEGLHAIHLSERVHRDVSSGNILLVPNSGTPGQRGVIMDLEYSKGVDDTSAPHDVRVGTETFMATEVSCMEHHRLTSLRSSFETVAFLQGGAAQHVQQLLARYREQNQNPHLDLDLDLNPISAPDPLPPFRHNQLHDMESIWWLCIWVMFYLVPSDTQGEQYIENYRIVFFNHLKKRDFVCEGAVFRSLTTHLSWMKPLVKVMNDWQGALNRLYDGSYRAQDISSKPSTRIRIDETILQMGYELGRVFLETLKEAAESISIDFVTLPERYQQPKKEALSAIASSTPNQ